MKRFPPLFLLLLLLLSAPFVVAEELTVAAAASLKTALKGITAAKRKDKFIYTFGSSGTLQKQIENGAPIDVFISASTDQMDALEKQGLIISESRTNFMSNRLALIVPNNFNAVTTFSDLTKRVVHHVALGETNSVPVGQYAAQALKSMQLLEAIQPKAVYGMDAEQVLAYVERGDAEAGLVYFSDAVHRAKVRIMDAAPLGSHKPILYCAAIVKGSQHSALATGFIQFLVSPAAQKYFASDGFTPIGNSR